MHFSRGGVLVLLAVAPFFFVPTGSSAQSRELAGTAQVPINPVALSVGADLLSADLAPSIWTVDAGSYRGAQVEIRPRIAASISRGGSHFWRLSNPDGGPRRIIGWSSESFPIPLAFRGGRRGALSEADSIVFWSIVRELEADLGTSLFRPVTLAPGEDPTDVIVVSLEPPRSSGSVATTLLTWNSFANAYDARISFRDAAAATDPGIVMHELMHALGFGHTTGWRSMMQASESPGVRTLTIEDVAYAQVALRARGVQERLIADDLDMAVQIREGSRSCHADPVSVKPGVTVAARWAERLDPERAIERVCW
jgi:hypothetical protein